MKQLSVFLTTVFVVFFSFGAFAQIQEDKLGAWYMYIWNVDFGESTWGLQGDVQYRNWNLAGDLEQLMLRGGLTYRPERAALKFTLGYANITSGEYGESKATVVENRVYQEALLPQKVGERFFLTHRFRFEQRFVESQDFRTRWRYAIFINVPLNKKSLGQGAVYLSFYDELFINGQRNIGNNQEVELFDRNRSYGALGYSLSEQLRAQLGYMLQTTDNWSKGQLQLSLHHNW